MNPLRERWHRWIMSLGCTDQGRAWPLELAHDEVVQLEPLITFALMSTTDQLRLDSIHGVPLTLMELRTHVEMGQGLTLWYRAPWWPESKK